RRRGHRPQPLPSCRHGSVRARHAPRAGRRERPRAGGRRRLPGPPHPDGPRARRGRRGPPHGGGAGVPPEAPMAARGPASGGTRGAHPTTLVGAGTQAYAWRKEALGGYAPAVPVVPRGPGVLARLAAFLTPPAWLSATLRRWVGLGALAGARVGMALFARAA